MLSKHKKAPKDQTIHGLMYFEKKMLFGVDFKQIVCFSLRVDC